MKILFAVPPYHSVNYQVPNGVGIVATVTKNAGFDVQVLLANINERIIDYHNRVRDVVVQQKIDIVALGGQSPCYTHIKQLIHTVKEVGATTILGGTIVDSSPITVPKNIGADYCVYGEGEFTFLELMNCLKSGDINGVSGIKGLIYLQNGELITSPPRECIADLDALPFVDPELCHLDVGLKIKPELIMMASRSCNYNCTFCYRLKGSSYRTKSLDYFFRELDFYIDKYKNKIESLLIMDYMFNKDQDRIKEFCRRIKPYNLPFRLQTRVDSVDEQIILDLKHAGAHTIAYGLESASNKVLKSMRKRYTIEKALNIIQFTKMQGMNVLANIIIGDIEDDMDTVSESEAFYLKYANSLDLFIDLIRVFPGTHLFGYALTNGIIKSELEFLEAGCPYVNVSKLPDDVYELLADKYKAFYSATAMITRRPLEKSSLELEVESDGVMKYTSYCPKCLGKNTVLIEDHPPQVNCVHCTQLIDIFRGRLFEGIDKSLYKFRIESCLKDLNDARIVIWGLTPQIRQFLIASSLLRRLLVKIVDLNFDKFRFEKYCGLRIERPEMLRDIEFDYVITGTVEKRHEVTKALEDMGKVASYIEIASVQ